MICLLLNPSPTVSSECLSTLPFTNLWVLRSHPTMYENVHQGPAAPQLPEHTVNQSQ